MPQSAPVREKSMNTHPLAVIGLSMLVAGCAGVRPPDQFIGNSPQATQAIERWRQEVHAQGYAGKEEAWQNAPAKRVLARRPVSAVLQPAAAGELAAEFGDEFALLGIGDGRSTTGTPQDALGLALSGGGPRSASFSIGVLKALHEERRQSAALLARVHYLSTVSGGGYAAYWYYNNVLDNGAWADRIFAPDDVFQQHLQKNTHILFDDECPVSARNSELGLKIYSGVSALFYPLTGALAWLPGFIPAIPHHFANTLFDWSWDNSVFNDTYRTGIERMYGRLALPGAAAGASGSRCAAEARAPDQDLARQGPRIADGSWLDFATLRARTAAFWQGQSAAGATPPLPLWIINTSGFSSNSVWASSGDKDLEKYQYEFTPLGYGSGLFGYFARSDGEHDLDETLEPGHKGPGSQAVYPHQLLPFDAVNASGAAVDAFGFDSIGQERTARLAAHLANFSLGTQLNNPIFGEQNRTVHRMLPLPFYYLHGSNDSADSPEIYLTDGGHTDNLGLFALVRRGLGKIIVIDASEDEKGRFDSLAETCARLEKLGVRVSFCRPGEAGSPPAVQLDIDTHDNGGRFVFIGHYAVQGKDYPPIGAIAYLKLSMPKADGQCAQQLGDAVRLTLESPEAPTLPCSVQQAHERNRHFPHLSTGRATTSLQDWQFIALRDLGEYLTLWALRSGQLAAFFPDG